MDMDRFWRWTVVALAAFGMMLVSAGIFGTMQLPSREEETVAPPELQLTKTDRAKSSLPSEIGWGKPDTHPGNRSANGQSVGGEKSTDVPDTEQGNPGESKQLDSLSSWANGPLPQHNQQVASLPITSPSDGSDRKQDVPQEESNGNTNRTVTVKVTPKAELTSTATSTRGSETSTVGGDEKGGAAATTVRAPSKNGSLQQDNQSVVGWKENKEEMATVYPGESVEKGRKD